MNMKRDKKKVVYCVYSFIRLSDQSQLHYIMGCNFMIFSAIIGKTHRYKHVSCYFYFVLLPLGPELL